MNTAINTIGLLIRKIEVINNKEYKTSKVNLHKQMITLIKKLKRNDTSLMMKYTIEKDFNKGFHTHLIINYNDEHNLLKQLSKYIGGNNQWIIKQGANQLIKECNGKYGEVNMHKIYDEDGFMKYMQKYGDVITIF